jgi:hypothetical protein
MKVDLPASEHFFLCNSDWEELGLLLHPVPKAISSKDKDEFI